MSKTTEELVAEAEAIADKKLLGDPIHWRSDRDEAFRALCIADYANFVSELLAAELGMRKAMTTVPIAWRVTGKYEDQPFRDKASAEAFCRGLNTSFPEGAYVVSEVYALEKL